MSKIGRIAWAILRQSGRTARLAAETFPLFLVVFDACLIVLLALVIFFFFSFLIFAAALRV